MEFARQHPDFCDALILFHSNPFSDSAQRKHIRQVYLDAFSRFGGDFFLKNFHEQLFYQNLPERTKKLKDKHREISVETLEVYTSAMKERKGYLDVLTSELPKLIIAGAFDKAITNQEYLQAYERSENGQLMVLANSAHMGMMEESDTASQAILDFVNNKVAR